jgi:hypothetical protein
MDFAHSGGNLSPHLDHYKTNTLHYYPQHFRYVNDYYYLTIFV